MYDHDILTKAIVFATQQHHKTIRKGSEKNPIPYILHPMEAAVIAATITNDPNVIAAALLHDVVEDTEVSIETIRLEFNNQIADLVADQSENKREDRKAEETWLVRKQETLDNLNQAGKKSKIVTLGDKLSNMRSIKRDYLKIGDKLWERFNQNDVKMQAWYYLSLKDALRDLNNYDAWQEYKQLVDEVFKEF